MDLKLVALTLSNDNQIIGAHNGPTCTSVTDHIW